MAELFLQVLLVFSLLFSFHILIYVYVVFVCRYVPAEARGVGIGAGVKVIGSVELWS